MVEETLDVEPMDVESDDDVKIPSMTSVPAPVAAAAPVSDADALKAGILAGNIHMATGEDVETMAMPKGSREAAARQARLIADVEERRQRRAVVVPTDVAEVKLMLRRLEQPITLYGERPMERRDRLRGLMAAADEDTLAAAYEALAPPGVHDAVPFKELFYTEGSDALQQARLQISRFSTARAAERLAGLKRKRLSVDEDEAAEAKGQEESARKVQNQCSEFGDERPIAAVAYSPDGSLLASGAWSGLLKLWGAAGCEKQLTVRAHDNRITGLAWHPESMLGASLESVNLATGSADSTAKLWSMEGKCLSTLSGHTDRLGRIAFHPSGRHLGTASFDQTWRLWDVESSTCLLEQEGHSRALYTVAFNTDGSLAASGGLDAVGRIWDLRIGRSILVLEGHVKGILSLDFSPNGYQLASGSEDHSVRVWDMRKKESVYTIPAHQSLVSQVRFEPSDGTYLMTAGYDNTVKLWSSRTWQRLRTLAGHEGRVMGADVSPDGSGAIASVSFDRTIKLWAPQDD